MELLKSEAKVAETLNSRALIKSNLNKLKINWDLVYALLLLLPIKSFHRYNLSKRTDH